MLAGQSPEQAPVGDVSPKPLRQHGARRFPHVPALAAHLEQLPGPAEPLGHVGAGVGGPVVAAVPAEAQGHVGVHVEGLGGGGVQLDDGGQAELAGGGGHMEFEALQVQTSADPTCHLERGDRD